MGNLAAPDRGTWISAKGNLRVEYSRPVLEDIRAAAVQGLCRFPRGGVEVGGVLLGSVRDGVVGVIAARPVECSYAMGPSFTLTEGDETSFRNAMADTGADLKPVGWYHSHTRSDFRFSADDASLHDRLFPEPWQVALVVRPEPFGSAEASFFARGDDGAVEPVAHGAFLLRPAVRLKASGAAAHRMEGSESSAETGAGPAAVQVLELDNPPEPESAASSFSITAPPSAASATVKEEPVSQPAAAASLLTEWRRPLERTGSRHGSRRLAWAGVAVALAAVAIWSGVYSRSAPAIPPHLALRVAEANGQLQITWDRNSAPLKKARGGSVSIRDGGQSITVPFDAERLRAGGLTYVRISRDVEVRMRVEGPVPAEESVRLFGPAVAPGPAMPAPNVVEPRQRPAEQPLKRPSDSVNLVAKPQVPAAGGRIRTDEPNREAPRLRPFRPATLAERVQAGVALPQPPPVQPAPSLGQDGVSLGVPTAGPPPLRTSEALERTAPAVPAAGRLIWVGRLERGGRLSIDGQRASSGSLTGELPGIPVRISAYPAELGEGQLRVFASSPGLRGNREAAGPRNGWNPTIYAWDARRASDVLVTEAPSAENRWRGISVRGNGRPVSVIVIDWTAAHP